MRATLKFEVSEDIDNAAREAGFKDTEALVAHSLRNKGFKCVDGVWMKNEFGAGMKVFRVNDCDWYIAPTIGTAIDAVLADTELPFDEIINAPRELNDDELDRLKFKDDDGTKRTFREELALQNQLGGNPRNFASTEY